MHQIHIELIEERGAAHIAAAINVHPPLAIDYLHFRRERRTRVQEDVWRQCGGSQAASLRIASEELECVRPVRRKQAHCIPAMTIAINPGLVKVASVIGAIAAALIGAGQSAVIAIEPAPRVAGRELIASRESLID